MSELLMAVLTDKSTRNQVAARQTAANMANTFTPWQQEA